MSFAVKQIKTVERLLSPVRIAEQNWPKGTQPVVSICCLTYNHEKFISECLEGFLMQETSFPVEIVVHDDASTDRTAEILREYASCNPQLFRLILQKENQHSRGRKVTPIVINAASASLIAYCEGDDYWTYPKKLQEQTEILRARPDLNVISHGCNRVIEGGGILAPWLRTKGSGAKEYTDRDVLLGVFDLMNTWLFRKSDFDDRFLTLLKAMPVGDNPLILHLLQDGRKGLSLEKLWSCYRQHAGGVWSQHPVISQHVRHLVVYVVHRCFYENRYGDELQALAQKTRLEIAIILLGKIVRLEWGQISKDLEFSRRFASNYFNPRKEWWLITANIPRALCVAVGRRLVRLAPLWRRVTWD